MGIGIRSLFKKHPGQIACTCPTCGNVFYTWESQVHVTCSRLCAVQKNRKDIKGRFFKKAVQVPVGCWKWNGKKNYFGYGRIRDENRREVMAHRVSYLIHKGEIPEGISVLHKCDNPECTNPEHLFLGTIADNNSDMRGKDRHARGERHGKAKITSEEAVKIIQWGKGGKSNSEICALIGGKISAATIGNITRGEKWKHVQSYLNPKTNTLAVAGAPCAEPTL